MSPWALPSAQRSASPLAWLLAQHPGGSRMPEEPEAGRHPADAVSKGRAQPGYPLEGVKVLDFSRVLAGPFASRMLCDLGADVVKVEPPEGDNTRLWGKVAA